MYRLLMRLLSGDITDWDVKYAKHWDSALKGNSSLKAHLSRALELELADFEGLYTLHFLWDMREFYDSIKVTKLIPLLAERGYPIFTMILGLITHKSPRTLVVGPSCSKPLENCGRSIIAGCQQSVSWARGLLYKLVESLGYILPGHICFHCLDLGCGRPLNRVSIGLLREST
jgi:hypothetical protein